MAEALVSKKLIAPKFKYSQGIKAGPHWYFSGLLGLDNDTGQLVPGGVGAETKKILENLQILMGEFGLEFGDLVFARVFASDFSAFPEFNAAWEVHFNSLDTPPPGRTSVGVNALPLGAGIEIEFTFYKE